MLNFWNLSRRLRPKIWPKEGQKFPNPKKLKILSEDKKNYSKITTFYLNKQKNTLLIYFLAFEGHLSQKTQQTNEQSIFLFVLAKPVCFAIIFYILT